MRRKSNFKFLVLLVLIACVIGCAVMTSQKTQLSSQSPVVGETKSAQPAQKTITIASFNIQILGEKKVGKVDVMETVAKIIRRYDLVAIQEVRSTHDDILKKLLGYVNMEGQRYDYIISSRLGRTTSKEQYAFIYNTATIKPIANSNYVVKDTDDVFEREPFVSSFKSGNFDFTLVDIHTKPEDTPSELTHLAVVVNSIYKNSKEKDIIALGDMNADGSYYKENTLNSIFSPWVQLIGNSVDTTVAQSSNTYDRMIASPEADKEYAGGSGVFRWDSEFGMTDMNYIKSVSDHYPVYAVFRTDLEDDD